MSRTRTQPKIILIGAGGVGCTFMEMIKIHPTGKRLLKKYQELIVFDAIDKSQEPTLLALQNNNFKVTFMHLEIVPNNVEKLIDVICEEDMVVDVSYNIHFKVIIPRCLDVGAFYINTSVERWELHDEHILEKDFNDRVLHEMHKIANKIGDTQKRQGRQKGTVLLVHGMNPGLISHFSKLGILNVAKKVIEESKKTKINNSTVSKLYKAIKKHNFPMMAYLLNLNVIHCAEKDTQQPKIPRKKGEFMNTWGSYSFYSEGVDPVQLGWGTHEKPLTNINNIVSDTPNNQIYLQKRGIDVTSESHTYKEKITGMLVSHSENDLLCNYLSLYNKHGILIYRPSCYYVYQPCPSAVESIDEIRKNNYKMLPSQKALRGPDILSGEDAVGALLIFENDPIERILYDNITPPVSYWSGSILNIEQTRAMGLERSGPTTVQVGASLLSAIDWMLDNPNKGIVYPENLPFSKILNDSKKYLGTIFTDFVPYKLESTQFKFTELPIYKNNTQSTSSCVIS